MEKDKMEVTPPTSSEPTPGATATNPTTTTSSSAPAEKMQVDEKAAAAPTPAPVPPPTVKNAPLSPLEYAKDTIQTWQSFNRHVNLKLVSVQDSQFLMDFTVGPSNSAFQVLFTDQWRPMIVMTSAPELEEYITNANVFLDDRANSSNPMSVGELLGVLSQLVPAPPGGSTGPSAVPGATGTAAPAATPGSDLFMGGGSGDDNENNEDDDNEAPSNDPPVEPKADDWENRIIPELRKHLHRENHPPYEVEELIFRLRNHLKRGGGGVFALEYVQSDILNGSRAPRAIREFFRNRTRTFHFNPYMSFKPYEQQQHFITVHGSADGTERLKRELDNVRKANLEAKGISAAPSGRDLYHWTVRFSGFDIDTDLGQDLANHHQIYPTATPPMFRRRFYNPPTESPTPAPAAATTTTTTTSSIGASLGTSAPDVDLNASGESLTPAPAATPAPAPAATTEATPATVPASAPAPAAASAPTPELTSAAPTPSKPAAVTEPMALPKIQQSQIHLEMKFPPDYPNSAPLFRLISPAMNNTRGEHSLRSIGESINLAASSDDVTEMAVDEHPPKPTTHLQLPGPAGKKKQKKALSVSSHLEAHEGGWNPETTLPDLLTRVRNVFLEGGARVDLSTQAFGAATMGTFWRSYAVVSPATLGTLELEAGGKILLPISALEEIMQFDDLNPVFHHMHMPGARTQASGHSTMTFEVSTQSGKRSFCGVLEFTAPEGQVCVPRWMMENLGVEEGVMLQVRRVALPKGEFIRLQPESADFLMLPDPKATLEWVLPQFVALATNDTFVISYNNQKYMIHVLAVQPGRAISIIDSDINLEFAPPRHGTVPEQPQQPHPAPAAAKPAPTATPAPAGGAPVAPVPKGPGVTTGSLKPEDNQVEGKDFKVCDNCKRKVPIGAFMMHSATCARMNYFCKQCDTAIPKADKQKHEDEVHKTVTCECGFPMEIRHLANHKENECPSRIVKCLYCDLKMPYEKRAAHENACGDRSEKCPNCQQYVARRAFKFHSQTCEPSSKGPVPIRGPGGGRWPLPASSPAAPKLPRTSSLFFCEKCQTPCNTFDELQVHMLTTHFEEGDAAAVAVASAASAASTSAEASPAATSSPAITDTPAPASSSSSSASASTSATASSSSSAPAAVFGAAPTAPDMAVNLSNVLESILKNTQPPPKQ